MGRLHAEKFHWYAPPEIFDLDEMATLSPEATRDQMAATAGFITRRE